VIDGEFDTQGWNRFSYVKGNPVIYRDPTGHDRVNYDPKFKPDREQILNQDKQVLNSVADFLTKDISDRHDIKYQGGTAPLLTPGKNTGVSLLKRLINSTRSPKQTAIKAVKDVLAKGKKTLKNGKEIVKSIKNSKKPVTAVTNKHNNLQLYQKGRLVKQNYINLKKARGNSKGFTKEQINRKILEREGKFVENINKGLDAAGESKPETFLGLVVNTIKKIFIP